MRQSQNLQSNNDPNKVGVYPKTTKNISTVRAKVDTGMNQIRSRSKARDDSESYKKDNFVLDIAKNPTNSQNKQIDSNPNLQYQVYHKDRYNQAPGQPNQDDLEYDYLNNLYQNTHMRQSTQTNQLNRSNMRDPSPTYYDNNSISPNNSYNNIVPGKSAFKENRYNMNANNQAKTG